MSRIYSFVDGASMLSNTLLGAICDRRFCLRETLISSLC
jgi:hypothetical protein